MKKIGFLESNLSGSGFSGLEIAKNMGFHIVFFTRDLKRYLNIDGAKIYFEKYVDEVVMCETNDAQSVINLIDKRGDRNDFAAFLTLGEYDVAVCAEVAKYLNLPGVNPVAALNARNKHLTRLACKRKGVPSPKFTLIENNEEDIKSAVGKIGLPCIVKPVDETSSADVLKCYSLSEVINQVNKISNKMINTRGQLRVDGVLVEEFLEGYEVSVETITYNNSTHILGVTDKFTSKDYFVEIGHNFPSSLPDNVLLDCGELARTSLEAIGYDFGVSHIEMKITNDGPKLIEINARPAGGKITDLVEQVNGFSYIKELIKMCIGISPDLAPKKGVCSGAAIRYLIGRKGKVLEVLGVTDLRGNQNIKEIHIPNLVGKNLGETQRNGDRLGYIITNAKNSFEAGRIAENAIDQIRLVYETLNNEEVKVNQKEEETSR